jgi:hypothetical protein
LVFGPQTDENAVFYEERHGFRDCRENITPYICLCCKAIVKSVRAAGKVEKYFVQEIAESI